MPGLKTLITALALSVSISLIPSTGLAKNEEWKDLQGNKFKGEPTELFGPFAIFKTGKYTGRKVLLQTLSTEDCQRLQQRIAGHANAADWGASKSLLAQDLKGNILRLDGENFVPATLNGKPEPRFLVVVFCNQGEGKSWQTLDAAQNAATKIQAAHPGMVEFLYFGVKHDAKGHKAMALAKRIPWLISDFDGQRQISHISAMSPEEDGYGVLVLTPEGVPLFQESPANEAAAQAFFNTFASFLDLDLPQNPRNWQSRVHYLRATLPLEHANDSCPPTLVGQVLDVATLRQNGATALKAVLSVAANGSVSAVELDPTGVPEKLRSPIVEALKASAFVPAIEKGKFVAGSYTMNLF